MSKGLTACIVKSLRMNSGTEMDRMTAEQKSIKTCRCGALGSVMTAAEGARVPPGPGIVGEAARKPVSIGERWFQLEPQREGNHGEVNDVGVMLVMGVNSRGPAGSVSGVGKHWKRDVRCDVGCLL